MPTIRKQEEEIGKGEVVCIYEKKYNTGITFRFASEKQNSQAKAQGTKHDTGRQAKHCSISILSSKMHTRTSDYCSLKLSTSILAMQKSNYQHVEEWAEAITSISHQYLIEELFQTALGSIKPNSGCTTQMHSGPKDWFYNSVIIHNG